MSEATNRPNLPAPRQVGPAVWYGRDLQHYRDDWIWRLTAEHVDELVAAAAPYAAVEAPQISTAAFALPTLAPQLADLRRRLINGRGFELMRGLPVADLSEQHIAAVFLGIGAHLGHTRSQNAAGDLLGHVRNVGFDVTDPTVRIYQTNERQSFHTDSTDVVGLCCLETAAEGGDSLLVSALTIYNKMLDADADLAAALFDPIATDRRGEVPQGAKPFFEIPVLNWHADKLTVIYQRQYVESAARFADAPPLTARQTQALNLFDAIANDPDVHLSMTLEPGDMQFVYNHALLHDRTGFVDKPSSPRHLLRLWLAIPGDRELPPVFTQRYGSITVGDRGGIAVD